MQHYKSIEQLIEDYENLSDTGRIYMEGSKKNAWNTSQFWVISSEEAIEQDVVETQYGSVPESLVEFKVKNFLDVGTFQAIIENKFDHDSTLSTKNVDILIEAIDHYLEYDDFLD